MGGTEPEPQHPSRGGSAPPPLQPAAWGPFFTPHVSIPRQPLTVPLSAPQSLLFLGLVAAVCLGLNLLFLTAYLVCLCCCKRGREAEAKRPRWGCVTWMAVTAGLVCW